MESGFVSVTNVSNLAEDTIKPVTVLGRSILLIKHAGQVFAITSKCPHMGCGLATGKLKEYIITCPCHSWSFDIRNGEYQANKAIKLATYECKVENGQVFVKPFDDF
jgi:nitrite reductase/ring-hydroxylating ferredoxin subunit